MKNIAEIEKFGTGVGAFIGQGVFRAAAHGLSSGLMNVLNGGDFLSGFASGAISSIVSSGLEAFGVDFNNFVPGGMKGEGQFMKNVFGQSSTYKVIMLASGGLSGGISSAIAGGKFMDGMFQGLIVAGLNHLEGEIFEKGTDKQNGGKKAEEDGRRNLRSEDVKVTFDPGADNPVSNKVADYFSLVMKNAAAKGIKSVNVSSTTNHSRNPGRSAHDRGYAFDINYVDGEHVSVNSDLTKLLQNVIKSTPGWRENYGPIIVEKVLQGNVVDAPWARNLSAASDRHYRHIHISLPFD